MLALALMLMVQDAPPPPSPRVAAGPAPSRSPALCRASADRLAIFTRLYSGEGMDKAMLALTGKARSDEQRSEDDRRAAAEQALIAKVRERYPAEAMTGAEFTWYRASLPDDLSALLKTCAAAPQ